jgi:gamma-glutamyl hydrolase
MDSSKDKRVPRFGIMMHYGCEAMKAQFPSPKDNYLFVPASYIQWITQAGAMAVIVPPTLPPAKLQALLKHVDGFILPGGVSPLYNSQSETSYLRSVKLIVDHAVKKQEEDGTQFPVFGICHGFQALCVAFSDGKILTYGFSDTYKCHPVEIEESEFTKSRFFSKLNQRVAKEVFSTPTVYYWHNFGISPDTLKLPEYAQMHDHFSFPGFSKTGDNHNEKPFATLLEHKKYPLYGTQFHPEKIQFERGENGSFIDRSAKSVMFAFDMALQLVEIARQHASHDHAEPEWLKPFFSCYMTPVISHYADYEHIYVMPRLFDDCAEVETDPVYKWTVPTKTD